MRGNVTRASCWMVRSGCTCPYKYGIGKPWKPSNWPDWVQSIAWAIEVHLKLPRDTLNSVNANKYARASENLFWHSDNESLFLKSPWSREVFIASVSFGGSREFCFRKKNGNNKLPSFKINDGDLLTMDGLLQETHQHTVLPIKLKRDDPVPDIRFNLTFRTIYQHVPTCKCKDS